MRFLIATILTLLIVSSGYSQTDQDSLRQIMNSNRPYDQQIDAAIKLVESYQLKNFDSTIIEGDKALRLARKNTDSIGVAQLKRHIGVANYFSGKYDVAAKYLQEAIAILEKDKKNRSKLAPVYNDLAKLYRKTRDLDKALENYSNANAIYRSLNDTAGIAMILNESGVVYEYKYDYKEAVNRYTMSMHLAEKAGDSLSVSYSLSNIAGVYVIEKKYDLAEKNLLRCLRIREILKDSFAMALAYSDLGVAMNGKGDYKKAIDYLTLSNRLAEKMRYPELQSNNYNELSAVSQKQGDFQKAFEYFNKRTALRDSLFNLEKTKEIQRLNSQYETARKEQQIQSQQNRIRMQNYLMAGIGVLVVLGLMLAFSYYKRYRLKQESQLQAEILKQQELKARAILEAEENERQRIAKDLHDGVGQMMSAAKMNLSAIESELSFTDPKQKESFDKAISLVDESCKEVRTVSHIMMPNALLRNSLGNAIHEFVNKLSNKTMQVHVYTEGLDEKMDTNVETVLYRVIQECVHNAMKHAQATNLDISLIRDKDGISGTVEDNGKGFDPADKENFEGIGLKNIITRIEYLRGTVDFDSAPGRGTVIAMHVPLQ
ncbi:MAG TPA: sensor histidine kinase [Chitinophagaceae bacterium]|nr:sensor histidine kinase [Chitinophagaceae bacterium]